jgi:hypothetical protein
MEDIMRLLNHWWRDGGVRQDLAKPYHRECFNDLKKSLNERQINVICGLRRVGKSTLIYQLIQNLIESGKPPLNILYFSFDKKVGTIKEVLDAYATITERDYEKEEVFMFIDEVYKLDEWHSELKLLYDALPNIKFVVSGSASLKVEKEARRDLTGRAFYIEVKPLSYKEYFELKFNTKIDNTGPWEDKLKTQFPAFMMRAFPETINLEKEKTAEYVNDLVLDKILFSDFAQTFKNVDAGLLKTLVEIFLSEPGMQLNVDSLSKSLRKSKNDLLYHIHMLELGYVIRIVRNYRGSIVSASRKLRKVYPYHPSLIHGAFKEVDEPKLFECFVRSHLDAEFYWRKNGIEVDFVHNNQPVEAKYKKKIQQEDIKNLLEFMREFKTDKGHLISKDTTGVKHAKGKTIKITPAWHFALHGLPP